MRKIIFLLLTATVLWSCQDATTKPTFTIKVTVIDPFFEGMNVRLKDGSRIIETAIVENGTFTFTGKADEDVLRYVVLGDNRVLILLEQGTIYVTFGDVITVSGTPINTAFHEFQLRRDELGLRAEWQELYDLTFAFVRDNIENLFGAYVFKTTRFSLFGDRGLPLSIFSQVELVELANDRFINAAGVRSLVEDAENIRNVAIGSRFVDFTMMDPEGNRVSLSDFVGQGNYTLIVFWATWCAPCIREIPHYIELYAKYKSKGFEIVSVSSDSDLYHDVWVNSIRNLNMTWPQMRGRTDLYFIPWIPYNVLLDREDIIIARNLRGGALNNKLAELMP